MKYAIVGSRDYPEAYDAVYAVLFRIHEAHGGASGVTIVSGGARGVDREAERVALGMGFSVQSIPAEWDKYGKSAGFRRNADIVGAADKVIALWDGESKGTLHSIELALKTRTALEVIFP